MGCRASLPVAVGLATACALLDARSAGAAGPGAEGADRPDVIPAAEAWSDVERPWLYLADPTAPPPLHVLAGLGLGYASVDRGAARPFAASSSVSAGAMAGLAAHPLAADSPVDLGFASGYLRELGGANGIWVRAAVAGDVGPVRLVLSALGEHVFEPDRDEVDVMLATGVSYALADFLRLGAEYVVQDLEGAWDEEEADGGIRHFVGPNLALELFRHRARLVAGPAVGLSPASPRLLGRVSAQFAF